MLDLFAFAYYALVCTVLAIVAPRLETALRRSLFGLCVGLIAVAAHPFIQSSLF